MACVTVEGTLTTEEKEGKWCTVRIPSLFIWSAQGAFYFEGRLHVVTSDRRIIAHKDTDKWQLLKEHVLPDGDFQSGCDDELLFILESRLIFYNMKTRKRQSLLPHVLFVSATACIDRVWVMDERSIAVYSRTDKQNLRHQNSRQLRAGWHGQRIQMIACGERLYVFAQYPFTQNGQWFWGKEPCFDLEAGLTGAGHSFALPAPSVSSVPPLFFAL